MCRRGMVSNYRVSRIFCFSDDSSNRETTIWRHVFVVKAVSRSISAILDMGLQFWVIRLRFLVHRVFARVLESIVGVNVTVVAGWKFQ